MVLALVIIMTNTCDRLRLLVLVWYYLLSSSRNMGKIVDEQSKQGNIADMEKT